MKHLLSKMLGSAVSGLDGTRGTVKDFYFDDRDWSLRYLECQLPKSLGGLTVLIPSGDFLQKEWDLPLFPVSLTVQQIQDCPPAASNLPVSKQKMLGVGRLITWPEMGAAGTPLFIPHTVLPTPLQNGDPHLRSFRSVGSYLIDSSKGVLGRIKDFIVNDRSWAIYTMIVRLGLWRSFRKVLVSPFVTKEIDWANGSIWTDLPVGELEKAPVFSFRQRPSVPEAVIQL